MRKDRENMLRSRLQTAITSRNTARIRFQTQADNLEQAKNAEQILLRNYETGRVDYNEVLDIMDMVIKIRLARIEAAHNYFIQSAVINYLAEPMQ